MLAGDEVAVLATGAEGLGLSAFSSPPDDAARQLSLASLGVLGVLAFLSRTAPPGEPLARPRRRGVARCSVQRSMSLQPWQGPGDEVRTFPFASSSLAGRFKPSPRARSWLPEEVPTSPRARSRVAGRVEPSGHGRSSLPERFEPPRERLRDARARGERRADRAGEPWRASIVRRVYLNGMPDFRRPATATTAPGGRRS